MFIVLHLDDPLHEYRTFRQHRLHAEFARLLLGYHQARAGVLHSMLDHRMERAQRWEAMGGDGGRPPRP